MNASKQKPVLFIGVSEQVASMANCKAHNLYPEYIHSEDELKDHLGAGLQQFDAIAVEGKVADGVNNSIGSHVVPQIKQQNYSGELIAVTCCNDEWERMYGSGFKHRASPCAGEVVPIIANVIK